MLYGSNVIYMIWLTLNMHNRFGLEYKLKSIELNINSTHIYIKICVYLSAKPKYKSQVNEREWIAQINQVSINISNSISIYIHFNSSRRAEFLYPILCVRVCVVFVFFCVGEAGIVARIACLQNIVNGFDGAMPATWRTLAGAHALMAEKGKFQM